MLSIEQKRQRLEDLLFRVQKNRKLYSTDAKSTEYLDKDYSESIDMQESEHSQLPMPSEPPPLERIERVQSVEPLSAILEPVYQEYEVPETAIAIELQTDTEAEFTAEPEVELSNEPEINVAAEPEVELSAEPEINVAAEPEVELSAEPEATLQSTTQPLSLKLETKVFEPELCGSVFPIAVSEVTERDWSLKSVLERAWQTGFKKS